MYTFEKLKQIRIIEKVDLYKGDAEKLKTFLETNGPWELLVRLRNLSLQTMRPIAPIALLPDNSVYRFGDLWCKLRHYNHH